MHDFIQKTLRARLAPLMAAWLLTACGGGGGGSAAKPNAENPDGIDLTSAVQVSSPSPQAGELVQITGPGLDRIAVLEVASIRLIPEKIHTSTGDIALRFPMPTLTLSDDQAISLAGHTGEGERIVLSKSAMQWCPIRPRGISRSPASPGMATVLTGACLNHVKRVRWGGMEIAVARKTADSLVVLIDTTQAAVHDLDLLTENDFSVRGPALAFDPGIAPGLQVDAMIGQLGLMTPASPWLRLIPGKPALVMGRISRPFHAASIRANARVELLNAAGTRFASYALQGDDAYPDVPGPDNAMESNYVAVIPPEQIAAIRTVRIVAEDATNGKAQSISFQPRIAPDTSFRLHLVPIARPGRAPAPLPDLQRVQTVLSAMFPVSRIEVVAHAPVVFPGSSDSFSQRDLFDLATLQVQEGARPYEFYFGIQPEARNAGLAYIGGNTAVGFHLWPTTSLTASLLGGNDAAMITELLAHEIAHNFGRIHSFSDNAFPYANNRIGAHAGLSLFQPSRPVTLLDTQWFDVMSYSAPKWFSDYSAHGVQLEAEMRAIRLPQAGARLMPGDNIQAGTPALRVLQINGHPDSGELSLETTLTHTADAIATQPVPESARTGLQVELWLRATLADGSQQWFVPVIRNISDGERPLMAATLTLPADTRFASIALVRNGSVVREWPDSGARQSSADTVTLQESAGILTARWDNRYRLTLVRVLDSGQRTAVAVNVTGGQLAVPAPAQPGGSWAWTLSDGLTLHSGSATRSK